MTPSPTRVDLQHAVANYLDRLLENAVWESSGQEAAARVLGMVDHFLTEAAEPAPHLSRDELIHIVEAAWTARVEENDGLLGADGELDDRSDADILVDALHEAGALPIGDPQ